MEGWRQRRSGSREDQSTIQGHYKIVLTVTGLLMEGLGTSCFKGWEKRMTKRETGFLLIGLGFGLLLALAVILEVMLSLYKSALIAAYSWDKVFLVAPILLLAAGSALILHRPRQPESEI